MANSTLETLSDEEILALYKLVQKSKGSSKERIESIKKFGYDVKFAYHIVRLLGEVEQILIEGDLDLLRNREQLKSVRRGDWTEKEIKEYFASKERELESIYLSSKLPHSPDENKIKTLLLNCLEEHFGNLDKCIVNPNKAIGALLEIDKILSGIRSLI